MTRDEIKRLIIALLPEGSEDLYALENSDEIGGLLFSLAGTIKETTTDRLEVLAENADPSRIKECISDWEEATGLVATTTSIFGSDEQRKEAVIAALRMAGDFSLDGIRAILQPYFQYADPTQIEIVEPNHSAQKTAHTYAGVAAGGPPERQEAWVSVADDPRVSPAGATLNFTITTTRLDQIVVMLWGPDGTFVQRPPLFLDSEPTAVVNQDYRVVFPEFAGKRIKGRWEVAWYSTGLNAVGIAAWSLFTEGLGMSYTATLPPSPVSMGLGAGHFSFVVVADPLLLGSEWNLDGARRALTRWKPAHVLAGITVNNAFGTACAIPDTDNAIPGSALPC